MPAISRQQLFAAQVVNNAAPTILITIPATPSGTLLINGRVRFSNYTAGPITVKAWAVPLSGSPADGNVALPTTTVGANAYIDVDVPQLSSGGTFQAQAGAATSITAQPIDGALYTS